MHQDALCWLFVMVVFAAMDYRRALPASIHCADEKHGFDFELFVQHIALSDYAVV
jgi:hypothetical protein